MLSGYRVLFYNLQKVVGAIVMAYYQAITSLIILGITLFVSLESRIQSDKYRMRGGGGSFTPHMKTA